MSGFRWVAVFVLSFSLTAKGGEWLQWRGPNLNGTSAAVNLPVRWSVETMENVAWVAPVNGAGSSTPIITEKFIFLTSSAGDERTLFATCYSRTDGTVVWSKPLATEQRKINRNGNHAVPSAVCDGDAVYFLFGQGTLAALSFDGELLWKRELETDYGSLTHNFGFSSSPLLHNGRLYIPILRRVDVIPEGVTASPEELESVVLSIDTKTGETLWTAKRLTDAEKESRDAYTTPMICSQGLIVSGADLITCHDLITGEERWRYDYAAEKRMKNGRLVSSPLVVDDLIISAYPRGKELFALTMDGKLAWRVEGNIPDVCTPAPHDGNLYVLDDNKRALSCINSKTGGLIWQQELGTEKGFFVSPLIADGKIYMVDLAGEVVVCATGDTPEILEKFSIHEADCRASLVAVDEELFLRTPTRLICVKKTDL